MTLALHPHVVQDRLEEQTQETRWDGRLRMDAERRVQRMGSGRIVQEVMLMYVS